MARCPGRGPRRGRSRSRWPRGSSSWATTAPDGPIPGRQPRGATLSLSPQPRPDVTETLTAKLDERIMIIDGAMGTAIQRDRPDEAGYRGERFADWPTDVVGNNDLLTITAPEI